MNHFHLGLGGIREKLHCQYIAYPNERGYLWEGRNQSQWVKRSGEMMRGNFTSSNNYILDEDSST